jgi:hypothetical protein
MVNKPQNDTPDCAIEVSDAEGQTLLWRDW